MPLKSNGRGVIPTAECAYEDGAQADAACCSSLRTEEHCSMINGNVVFCSKNVLVTSTWGCNAAIRWHIKSEHFPILRLICSTKEQERELKVAFIQEFRSSSTRAPAAQALIAEIGFEIESVAASHELLLWTDFTKDSRAEKVSLVEK